MDGIGLVLYGRVDKKPNVQVRVSIWPSNLTKRNCLVCLLDKQCIFITKIGYSCIPLRLTAYLRIGENDYRCDANSFTGFNDPASNLSTVGDQHAPDHRITGLVPKLGALQDGKSFHCGFC